MKLQDKHGEEDMQLIAITFMAPSIKVRREKEQQKAFNLAKQASIARDIKCSNQKLWGR
jgi:hypothetical protein